MGNVKTRNGRMSNMEVKITLIGVLGWSKHLKGRQTKIKMKNNEDKCKICRRKGFANKRVEIERVERKKNRKSGDVKEKHK